MARVELVLALNTSAAEQAVARLSKQTQQVLAGTGSTGLAKSAVEAGAAFSNAQKSAQEAVARQQQLVASMIVAGAKGSAEFTRAKQELEKASAAARQIDDAMNEAKKIAGEVGKSATTNFEKLAGVMRFNETREAVTATADAINSFGGGFVALDTAVAKFKTLGSENAKLADDLKAKSVQIAGEIPFQAAQIADAMTNAAASGVQGGVEELASFTQSAAKLAVGGGAELDAVVQGLGGNLNAFGATAADAGKYADIMFNTVNEGVTSIDELNQYLSGVTATASSAGVSFGNVGGAIALMTQKNVPAAQATTKLNALLIELQKPGKALEGIFKQAGLSTEQLAATIKTKGLPAALDLVSGSFKKAGVSATQAFSSSEAGAAFNLLQAQAGQFQGFADRVENTSGSAQFAYNQMAETVAVKSQQFSVNVETMKTKLLSINPTIGASVTFAASAFSNLAPQLTPLLLAGSQLKGVFSGSFEFLKTNLRNMPQLASTASKAVGGAFTSSASFLKGTFAQLPSLAASAASSIGGLFTAPAATISTAFNSIKLSAATAWASITAPAVLVVAAVALVGAALYAFFTQTDEGAKVFANIKQYFLDLWQSIKDFGVGVAKTIGDFYTNNKEVFEQIGGIIIELGRFVFEWMITPFQLAWQAVKLFGTGVSLVASAVANFIAKLLPAKQEVAGVATATTSAKHGVNGMAAALLYVRGVIGGVTGAFGAIKNVISEFVDAIADLNINRIKQILTGAGDNISKGFTDGWNKATVAAQAGAAAQTESTQEAAAAVAKTDETAATAKAEQNKKALDAIAKQNAEALKKYLADKNAEITKEAEKNAKMQEALAISREVATTTSEQLTLDTQRVNAQKTLLADLQRQLQQGVVANVKLNEENKNTVKDSIEKLQDEIAKTELDFKPRVAKIQLETTQEQRRLLQQSINQLQVDINARVVPVTPARRALINKLTEQIAGIENQIKLVALVDPAKADELRAKVKELTNQISSETKILISDEYISSASTVAEQEYRKLVTSAQDAFNERVKIAGRSRSEELADFNELIKARLDAEQAYARESATIAQRSVSDVFTAFADRMKNLIADAVSVSDEEKSETEKTKAELKKREIELEKSLNRRKISLQEYYDGLADLEKEREESAKQNGENQTSIFNIVASSATEALRTQADAQLQLLNDTSKSLLTMTRAESLYANRKEDIASRLTKITDSTSAEYKALQEEMVSSERARVQASQQATEQTALLYQSMATSIGVSLGAALAEGKNVLKSMVLAALDAVQAMIPVWSLQIAGVMFSSPNPANALSLGAAGTLAAAGLTAVLTALAQAAKAAVSGVGFRKGGHTGNVGVDTVAGIVHGQEFVHTAENTRKNRAAFETIHRENITVRQYAEKYLSSRTMQNTQRDYDYVVAERIDNAADRITNEISAVNSSQRQLNKTLGKRVRSEVRQELRRKSSRQLY